MGELLSNKNEKSFIKKLNSKIILPEKTISPEKKKNTATCIRPHNNERSCDLQIRRFHCVRAGSRPRPRWQTYSHRQWNNSTPAFRSVLVTWSAHGWLFTENNLTRVYIMRKQSFIIQLKRWKHFNDIHLVLSVIIYLK